VTDNPRRTAPRIWYRWWKRADHESVAPGDHEHRQPAERDAQCRSERPGGLEEVAREDETAEADDAAERQRRDLERREDRLESRTHSHESVTQVLRQDIEPDEYEYFLCAPPSATRRAVHPEVPCSLSKRSRGSRTAHALRNQESWVPLVGTLRPFYQSRVHPVPPSDRRPGQPG